MAKNQRDEERGLDRDVGVKRQSVMRLFMPIALVLCITQFLPTDLFSTAKWWDAQGFRLVWTDTVYPNGIIARLNVMIPGTASIEAVGFSAGMILFQLIATLKIYEEGSWLLNGSSIGFLPLLLKLIRRKEKFENVNPGKMVWLFIWIFCVAFDAYTSYVYRTSTGANKWVTIIVHSIFAENILSEILLGESLRITINLIAVAVLGAPVAWAWLVGYGKTWKTDKKGRGVGRSEVEQFESPRESSKNNRPADNHLSSDLGGTRAIPVNINKKRPADNIMPVNQMPMPNERQN